MVLPPIDTSALTLAGAVSPRTPGSASTIESLGSAASSGVGSLSSRFDRLSLNRPISAAATYRFTPTGVVKNLSKVFNLYKMKAASGLGHIPFLGLGVAAGSGLGGFIGSRAGKYLGKYTGWDEDEGQDIGSLIGGAAGLLIPFKNGGKVEKTGPIYAHKGEFVLPKGLQPTAYQRKIVQKKRCHFPKDNKPFRAKK